MKTTYSVLGAMAGSSMDGLDLILATFSHAKSWNYTIESCATIPYESLLYKELREAKSKSPEEQKKLDISFGHWIATIILDFLNGRKPDLMAVHGHTLIHAPERAVSWQLGDGKEIASITGIPTITAFRSLDVKNGGQGAPLVPFGDFTLFKSFDACLNLGGIANVSILASKTAWDICPCNQVLNYYSNLLGHDYDKGGLLARKGDLNSDFMSKLEEISYFKQSPPKSLPNAFISKNMMDSTEPFNGLRTYTEFIAQQIKKDLDDTKPGKLLITGGGTFNTFLVERIKDHLTDWKIVIPTADIISYKEALVFAFLGLKKSRGENNVLRSVTGALMDSSSGVIHLPE